MFLLSTDSCLLFLTIKPSKKKGGAVFGEWRNGQIGINVVQISLLEEISLNLDIY